MVAEQTVAAVCHRLGGVGLGLVLAGLARVVRHALAVDPIADPGDGVVRTTLDNNNAGHAVRMKMIIIVESSM